MMASSSSSSSDPLEGTSTDFETENTVTESEILPTDTSMAVKAPSLLSRLKSPTASALARKRKVPSNPPIGRKKSKGSSSFNPKTVVPADRVKLYPNEYLKVHPTLKMLFCTACREPVSLKKSVIDLHIKSSKHVCGKKKVDLKEKKENDIGEMLKDYDKDCHPVGENLSNPIRVYRVKVISTFMKAGVPLHKVDCFRNLLEETGFSLAGSQHLRELIPCIQNNEKRMIKDEVSGKCVSVIFDGTTHVCEAMAILLHYVDENWNIQQRLVRLMLLAKSLTGEEVACNLISTLSTDLGIASRYLLASMRDRASVNSVAMQTVRIVYPNVLDIGCFSHTLDLVGEKLATPVLDEFMRTWLNIFSRSPKTKLAWRTLTGLSPTSYCPTRWWSKWEVIKQVHDTFGDVQPFVTTQNLPPASKVKLAHFFSDPTAKVQLQLELAITVDFGEIFVKTTYNLEGDGPLAFIAYEKIHALYEFISTANYPNSRAITRKLAGGDPNAEQRMTQYYSACVTQAIQYFKQKFDTDLKLPMLAFKSARYFDPVKAYEIKPGCNDIDDFKLFSFIDNSIINGLKSELPQYLAASEDVSSVTNKLQWWKAHASDFPYWSNACKMILLLQPSSAAAERVFSREYSLNSLVVEGLNPEKI